MAAAFPLGQTERTGAVGATVTEQQVLFLVNPAARSLPSRARLEAAIAALRRDHPFDPLIWETDGPDHATALAAQAEAAGVSRIVVCGGDGTLNEALNGLRRADLPVAVIPGGTANVWAKEAGIPRDPEQALRAAMGRAPSDAGPGTGGRPPLPLDGRPGARRRGRSGGAPAPQAVAWDRAPTWARGCGSPCAIPASGWRCSSMPIRRWRSTRP